MNPWGRAFHQHPVRKATSRWVRYLQDLLFCPLSLHWNVPLTHAPVWQGLGLVTASRELLPPPSTAVPSSAQPVLPPPFTLLHSCFSWEKVLLHSSICVGQWPPLPATASWGPWGSSSFLALLWVGEMEEQWRGAPHGRVTLGGSCNKWFCVLLVTLMLCRFGTERSKAKACPDYQSKVSLQQYTAHPVLIPSQ